MSRDRFWDAVVTHDFYVSYDLYICMSPPSVRSQQYLSSFSIGIKGIRSCSPCTMSQVIESSFSPAPALFYPGILVLVFSLSTSFTALQNTMPVTNVIKFYSSLEPSQSMKAKCNSRFSSWFWTSWPPSLSSFWGSSFRRARQVRMLVSLYKQPVWNFIDGVFQDSLHSLWRPSSSLKW